MTIYMKKKIHTVCFCCGEKFGKRKKEVMGMWLDTCDICHNEMPCANAQHDFSIFNTPEEAKRDKIQENI